MLDCSNDFKNYMNSTFRLKCEPRITVTSGNNRLVWEGKNITDLSYKQGCDPLGRKLPYCELTWTERYSGKLNKDAMPEKYENTLKHGVVEFEIIQDLGYNNWEGVRNTSQMGNVDWSYYSSKNWSSLPYPKQEVLRTPKLFLKENPIYDGQKITWTAVDVFSTVLRAEGSRLYGIPRLVTDEEQVGVSVPLSDLLEDCSAFFDVEISKELKDISTDIKENTTILGFQKAKIPKAIFFNGGFIQNAVNYAAALNTYFAFKNKDLKIVNGRNNSNTENVFSLNLQYSPPKITKNPNVSSCVFGVYDYYTKSSTQYSEEDYVSPQVVEENGQQVSYWYFKEPSYLYGNTVYDENLGTVPIEKTFTYAKANAAVSNGTKILPYKIETASKKINEAFANIGEVYEEDNPYNIFDNTNIGFQGNHDYYMKFPTFRSNRIKSYYDESRTVEIEVLPFFHLQTNDYIRIETNMVDDSGRPINLDGTIVDLELTYNGSWKEKIICGGCK